MISAKLLTYNTSFVNSWYGIVPFPTSEYAFIRKKRNALFQEMLSNNTELYGLKINNLLDLLVNQPKTPNPKEEEELTKYNKDVDTCAPYYIIPYKKCLEVVSTFLEDSTSDFIAVSLQEQNYTKHSFDAINEIIQKENIQIISNYVVAGFAYPALTSIFKVSNEYKLVPHNGSLNAIFSGKSNKNAPIVRDDRKQMLIFDVGADFKYKKLNGVFDNGRPCGIVRFDKDNTTILHINCHLPNPSVLSSNENESILESHEKSYTPKITMEDWATEVIATINKITKNLDSYYSDKTNNDIIVFFSGDMNDSYGVLMKMLGESKLMINNTPITIKFNPVNATCCANSNSTTATFEEGKKAGPATTSITNFPDNKWDNYQDGWDKDENYKFQGDNIGVGYLTSSNPTYNPYSITSGKYNPTDIDTTYSDHSPVESTIEITTAPLSGGYKRRRRKTKRTNKHTYKRRTNKRKSRK
jgi:hypothetical protein